MTYANPAAIMETVSNAFWQGHDRVKQARTQNALAAFMQNPSMEGIANVAQHDPMIAYQLRGMEEKRQAGIAEQRAKARQVAIQREAAAGNPEALAELAGIDYAAWKGIKAEQREDIAAKADYIGNAALEISQMPENEQAQKWDEAIAEGAKQWPDLAEYAGQYSPQRLASAIRMAGMVKTLHEWSQPDYQPLGPGERFVNVRDPEAVRQSQQQPQQQAPPQVTDQGSYDAIPPGQEYIDPQGNVRVKPGGAGGNASGNFPSSGN